jgi:GT2 family glycosyltransferase
VLPFPTLTNQLLDTAWLRSLLPNARIWRKPTSDTGDSAPYEVEAVSGACIFIQRKVFERVNGFSDEYFMYAEDLDLAHKTRSAGFRNYHVPSAVVLHHGGSSSGRAGSTFSAVMIREANRRFFVKTRGAFIGKAYRGTMLLAAASRLIVLAAAWPWQLGSRNGSLHQSMKKWRAIGSWALGRDAITRRYYSDLASG